MGNFFTGIDNEFSDFIEDSPYSFVQYYDRNRIEENDNIIKVCYTCNICCAVTNTGNTLLFHNEPIHQEFSFPTKKVFKKKRFLRDLRFLKNLKEFQYDTSTIPNPYLILVPDGCNKIKLVEIN